MLFDLIGRSRYWTMVNTQILIIITYGLLYFKFFFSFLFSKGRFSSKNSESFRSNTTSILCKCMHFLALRMPILKDPTLNFIFVFLEFWQGRKKSIVPVEPRSLIQGAFQGCSVSGMTLKYMYGVNAWKNWVQWKNAKEEQGDLKCGGKYTAWIYVLT